MPPFIENNIMGYGESDTRAKLIDPAIHLTLIQAGTHWSKSNAKCPT
jgi:hypothetical protein